MTSRQHIEAFISLHRLPVKFQKLITEHFNPLVSWLTHQRRPGKPLLLGISGAQGTGKSTLADFLQLSLTEDEGWHVAVLSIDDFYLTKEERQTLGNTVHPLLSTRGVPGTHDLQLLFACIDQLRNLDAGNTLSLPRFDKARDDRAKIEAWPTVTGPIDLIILEGWCVGSTPQAADELSQSINQLERDMDRGGSWRQYVNKRLAEDYADLFAELDFLFFLRAPSFESVLDWRIEQEEKLAEKSTPGAPGIMSSDQIEEFIQHYERLTRANLISLPKTADVVLQFDESHDCIRTVYKNQPAGKRARTTDG